MRKQILQISFLVLLHFSYLSLNAQIEDIKKSSTENKSNSSSSSSYSNTSSSSSSDDFGEGCMSDAFSCCFNNGFLLAIGIIAENHQSIMKLIETDPTVFSFEARANFAVGLHFSSGQNYTYVNYLPGVRGNIGAFSTDFRFNILTEYTNDFPNSISSWEWLFLFNIQPVETFKLTFGTGVQRENFSDSYFNEHYIGFRFGQKDNHDFIYANTRFSIDYATSAVPFVEIGFHYRKRIAAFNNVFMYITIGGIYQNYYQSHDIWAFQGGLIINVH